MTTEIFEGKSGNVTVTRFCGTDAEGQMVQITARNRQEHNGSQPFKFVQMRTSEFEEMVKAFVEFKKVKDF